MLCQEVDGKLAAIAYNSHRLTSAEQGYPITELEGLAVLHFVRAALRAHRHFLVGMKLAPRFPSSGSELG